jgi:hypothetical protein
MYEFFNIYDFNWSFGYIYYIIKFYWISTRFLTILKNKYDIINSRDRYVSSKFRKNIHEILPYLIKHHVFKMR